MLMELCAYREERAQAMDQPPFRVLPNQTLLELAQLMPRKRSELNQVFGLSPKLIDRYGEGLLEAVERGIVGPPAYRPDWLQRPSDAVSGAIGERCATGAKSPRARWAWNRIWSCRGMCWK